MILKFRFFDTCVPVVCVKLYFEFIYFIQFSFISFKTIYKKSSFLWNKKELPNIMCWSSY